MNGKRFVPDSDHIARLCGGSHVREDGTIAPTAFKPHPGESYLSVNWLECLDPSDRTKQLRVLRQVLAAKRKIGASARLALMRVGNIRETVRRGIGVDLSVEHEPEEADPSHSGIYGVVEDEMVVPDLLASAVDEVYAAEDGAPP